MVKWSRLAKRQLKAIHDFIAEDSPYYAKEVASTIVEKTQRLELYPSSGRMVPEVRSKKIREIFAYSYRIIYEVHPEDVIVLTIVHCRKNFTKP